MVRPRQHRQAELTFGPETDKRFVDIASKVMRFRPPEYGPKARKPQLRATASKRPVKGRV